MSKLIYKSEKPYTEDLNDLVEDEITKGRGPDLQPRKRRGGGSLQSIGDQDAAHERRQAALARHKAGVAERAKQRQIDAKAKYGDEYNTHKKPGEK